MKSRKKLIVPLLLPSLLILIVFFILPAIDTVIISFQDWNSTFRTYGFEGLNNYRQLRNDPTFLKAVGHTFEYFFLITIILFPVALFLSIILQRVRRGRNFFQLFIFIPVTLSIVVAAILWKWYIYDPNMGLLNNFLRSLGLKSLTKPWLGNSKTAMFAVAVTSTWHGLATWMILIISGLDRIPSELMESARLDGANEWIVFIHITLPLLWEVLSSLIILNFINAMQQFPVIYNMTNGGPYGRTELMGTYLYKVAFEGKMFSYGSAMAVVMAVIIMIVAIPANRLIRSEAIEY